MWRSCSLSGQLLKGRYRIRGLLAQGAMAAVYLADDEERGEPVAVKMLRTRRRALRERLLQEVATIASLDHPGLVRIHDTGEMDDATPYVVMEYLQGETLGDLLRRQGSLLPAQALPLFCRIALALDAAHAAGVVHRDVKPDNLVLLGPPGDPHDARVVDFGLAKGALRLTETGVAVGTAEYMAPEQALTDPVDGRTDLYALGVVMYRTFAGRLPFDGADKLMLLGQHILGDPPPLPPSLGGLARVIVRSLRKRPAHRYASMRELAGDLERLLQQLPGPLLADDPDPDDDTYAPTSAFGCHVIASFYRMMQKPVPDTLKELVDGEED